MSRTRSSIFSISVSTEDGERQSDVLEVLVVWLVPDIRYSARQIYRWRMQNAWALLAVGDFIGDPLPLYQYWDEALAARFLTPVTRV